MMVVSIYLGFHSLGHGELILLTFILFFLHNRIGCILLALSLLESSDFAILVVMIEGVPDALLGLDREVVLIHIKQLKVSQPG